MGFNEIFKGLEILNDYAGCEMAAEHDEIFAGPSGEKAEKRAKEAGWKKMVAPQDAKKLEKLGWYYDKSFESWHHFT